MHEHDKKVDLIKRSIPEGAAGQDEVSKKESENYWKHAYAGEVLKNALERHVARLAVGAERKDALTKIGAIGGKKRHELTSALKSWALEKAAGMRGADMDKARRLAQQLPENLREASTDPERLIYDALRADRKTRQARQP